MADKETHAGIYDGFAPLIQDFLGLERGESLTGLRGVPERFRGGNGHSARSGADFGKLVSDLYARMEANRAASRRPASEASTANWRLTRETNIADHNRDAETVLEKSIAMLAANGHLPGWHNQCPTASGLYDSHKNRRAAVDLVWFADGQAELVELKVESDNPASAMFQILQYGIAYLFCREHVAAFGYREKKLLRAERIDLAVLAPAPYFQGARLQPDERREWVDWLEWLANGLSGGLAEFALGHPSGGFAMGLRVTAFPDGFQPPFARGDEAKAACDVATPHEGAVRLIDAMGNRQVLWGNS